MIRLFAANETDFGHYETILTDVLSFETEEEENGIFFCEMTCPLDDRITEGKIIKAPTARGEQLFRIVKVKKTLPAMTLYVYGRHIFYDLLDNFLLNIRPTDKTLNNALADILNGTEYAHPFTATSDVPGIATANYVRMNPVAAIMGNQENSALNLWGGFMRRNNFAIQVFATAPDRGYEVRFGKNLLGADEELDMTDVVTRFYPTVVIAEPTVTVLPEKCVDSPLINNYSYPIIREYRIDLTDAEKLLPIADIYQLMRDRCNAEFTLKADLPKVNYKIDFVELRKTEQYKDFAVLEELDISDTVWVYVDPLNLNMTARMIKYRHDGLYDRFLSMELGNFKPKLTNAKTEFKALIESATKDLTDGTITAMLKDAVDKIQGNMGGNVVTLTLDGKPVAHAYMDTDDINTANDYVIVNSAGIAFGTGGLNNPANVAIDIHGNVVSTSGFFASLKTNLISSDLGSNLVLSSNTSIKLLANSLVTINENGLTIDDGVSPTVSRHTGGETTYIDRVTGNPFASYGAGVADVDVMNARKVYSPHVANKLTGDITVYVASTPTGDGSGRDSSNKAPDVDTALKTALDGANVVNGLLTIDIAGKVTDDFHIDGLTGSGRILVKGSTGQIMGQIAILNCGIRIDIRDLDIARPSTTATAALISAINSMDVRLDGCRLDGYSVGTGIGAYYGGGIYATNCDIVKCEYAYDASVNGRIAQVGCRGANNLYVGNSALGSNIVLSGTRPIATNIKRETAGGVITDASSTGQTSTFAATPATWKTQTKTFTANLSTSNHSTGYVWKTGTWTQGTWDGTAQRGYADFGSSIRDWLNSAGGYRNISSVIIKAHRNTSSGSGSVSLKIASPSAQSLPAVARGGTSQASLVSGLVTAMTSGALKLNSSTTATADYAGFDKIEIIVTAEKKA